MAWICPHCGTTATLQPVDMASGAEGLLIKTAPDNEGMLIRWHAIRCPSKTCGKYVLDVWSCFADAAKESWGRAAPKTSGWDRPVGIGHVRFEPRVGVPLSSYAAAVVVADYNEACLIKDLSPKAAATLCRRALQGMVRDYWGISKATLAAELAAIKDRCDPALFEALMGLKAVGNIGAHPERDINVIIDVEEGEVESLLELIRILDREWYVGRARRAESLAAVASLGVKSAPPPNAAA